MADDVQPNQPVPPVTAENLNFPADFLDVLQETVATLKTNGFMEQQTDGHWRFVNPTVGEIVTEATAIETLLKEHGLKVSPKVDKAIQSLPLLIQFLGN